VCCHVEEEEVLLFGAQDAFIDEAFRQSLSHLFELVSNLHHVPCFAWRMTVQETQQQEQRVVSTGPGQFLFSKSSRDLPLIRSTQLPMLILSLTFIIFNASSSSTSFVGLSSTTSMYLNARKQAHHGQAMSTLVKHLHHVLLGATYLSASGNLLRFGSLITAILCRSASSMTMQPRNV